MTGVSTAQEWQDLLAFEREAELAAQQKAEEVVPPTSAAEPQVDVAAETQDAVPDAPDDPFRADETAVEEELPVNSSDSAEPFAEDPFAEESLDPFDESNPAAAEEDDPFGL